MKKKIKVFLLIGTSGLITSLFVAMIPSHFVMPVEGATIKSYNQKSFWAYPWGKSGYHKGVDIFAKLGTPVLSSTMGFVVFTAQFSLGGNVVLVISPGWKLHYYAHLKEIKTSLFSLVDAGDQIGTVGTTGNAKGKPPHLHYSIQRLFPKLEAKQLIPNKKSFYVDPTPLLNGSVNKNVQSKALILGNQTIFKKDYILLLLSFSGEADVEQVKQTIENFYGITTVVKKADMPIAASAHDRGRYNANKILDYLQQQYPNQKVIALTSNDICTNLNGQLCWGILGLSYLGKLNSVSSVHRIKSDKSNLLSKVAIHEVGHGLGLPHCKSSDPCLMKDAMGKIATIKQQPKKFCNDCSQLLRGQEGLRLQ
jgi:murein DD-endopeptidase MepM/ murein hydrolase activator NlpD